MEAQLADPAVFSSPSRVQEVQQQLEPATREVERLYARWQELQNLAAPQSA
ncbi:MAG TPA: ABC transporter C-terminal domain-containing protein [Aggregicoccus sp.]|nr:ABC transporter C-terminal domain-containing protein [Aggregicoccus sp.]